MKTIEVPEQFLKDLYKIKCVSDLKTALEKHFGEVVKNLPEFEFGSIFLSTGCFSKGGTPYYTISKDGEYMLASFEGGWGMAGYNKPEFYVDKVRPMRSGTITIQVRNGKVAGATVQED